MLCESTPITFSRKTASERHFIVSLFSNCNASEREIELKNNPLFANKQPLEEKSKFPCALNLKVKYEYIIFFFYYWHYTSLGLFDSYLPLVPILRISLPISNVHYLQIVFYWIQPHNSRCAYSSSALRFMDLCCFQRSSSGILQRFLATSTLLLRQFLTTVGLHLSAWNRTASHLDMRKIQIIGFFFENGLNWPFEVRLLLFTVCTCVLTFRPHLIWSSRSHNTVLYLIW